MPLTRFQKGSWRRKLIGALRHRARSFLGFEPLLCETEECKRGLARLRDQIDESKVALGQILAGQLETRPSMDQLSDAEFRVFS